MKTITKYNLRNVKEIMNDNGNAILFTKNKEVYHELTLTFQDFSDYIEENNIEHCTIGNTIIINFTEDERIRIIMSDLNWK